MPADLVTAHVRSEAESIVAEARREAAAILAEAQRRAEMARDEAEREGREAAEASLAPSRQRLQVAVANGPEEHAARQLSVGRSLAERLLAASLERDPSLIADLARVALSPIVRARRVALYAHPADVEPLRERLSELGLEAAAIAVHADSNRPRGGLRAETDEGVAVDADIGPQLDRLVAALRRPAG